LTTVTFTAARDVNDTGVIGSGGVLETRAGVQVDHELLRNVILTGGVQDTKADYAGIDRNDRWLDANVGAVYMLNRHVGVGATYYYSNYRSDNAGGPGFRINRAMVSLTLKL
jgi:hypothetical protein